MGNNTPLVQLSHGSGGYMMHRLIRDYFAPAFDLKSLNDSAVIDNLPNGRLAVTTDSYVISPYFFPGGDIGLLAVCGTVNDLSMAGAKPLYLTSGFIIEEGFPLDHLKRILDSMQAISREIGVKIIAGDTKVVERGKGDGIFINTAGIGVIENGIDISPRNIRPGDKVILSGSIGNHGMSVMAQRSGISFEPQLCSDVRPLNSLVDVMLRETKKIHAMRDPTRGGIATTLKEFANESGYCIIVEEEAIEVLPAVRGACELLGLDPLYVANEGALIAIVDKDIAEILVEKMKTTKTGERAAIIGEVVETPQQTVLFKTAIGGARIIDMLSGEQLPRIC
ncbi:MAG: hydrogenase expression/formation protein HypE [Nitrospira bacterium HGW-Nitrospira-1]|nr:MAG: hydrogenase expression/formation protein HypE [Nitrospira bacterium HGW-Nitrospira-1]